MEAMEMSPIKVGAKSDTAYVSLLYGSGSSFMHAMVLGYSLREAQSESDTVLLLVGKFTSKQRKALSKVWEYVLEVENNEIFDRTSKAVRNTYEGGRYEFALNKLHALRLTEYQKILLLDVDTYVHTDVGEVFDFEAPAAQLSRRDLAWQNGADLLRGLILEESSNYEGILNCGVVLLEPNLQDLELIIADMILCNDSNRFFSQPDRDFLTRHYRDRWSTLSAEYNFRPAFVEFEGGVAFGHDPMSFQIRISHFAGCIKPSDLVFHTEKVSQSDITATRKDLCARVFEFPLLCHLEDAKTAGERFVGMHKAWLEALHEVAELVERICKVPLLSICTPSPTVMSGEYNIALANIAHRKAKNSIRSKKRIGSHLEVRDGSNHPSGPIFKFHGPNFASEHGANTIKLKAG
jgi:hypothetical protein